MSKVRKTMWIIVPSVVTILTIIAVLWLRYRYKVFSFHVDVANAYFETVNSKLVTRTKLVNARGRHNWTALHWAALQGTPFASELLGSGIYTHVLDFQKHRDYSSLIRLLLEKGADINAVGDAGSTPLHLASAYGKVGVVKLLVEGGARIDLKDKRGRTALDRAIENDKDNIIEYLKSIRDKAGKYGDKEEISQFSGRFKTYDDSKIIFSYPEDMRIIQTNEKWGIYSIVRPRDEFAISIQFFGPDIAEDIERNIRHYQGSDQLIESEYFPHAVFGNNRGIARSYQSFDAQARLISKRYDLLFESEGERVQVIMDSIASGEDFDINDYADILASIKVKSGK